MSEQQSMQPIVTTSVKERGGAADPVAAPPSQIASTKSLATSSGRKWILVAALVVFGGLAYLAWNYFRPAKLPEGFASSNGRIEATEVDIATKLPGRIKEILVDEGAFVTKDQVVAYMDTESLQAQLRESQAKWHEAKSAVATAHSMVAQRKSEKEAAEAVVTYRLAELELARKNVVRADELVKMGGMSKEEADTRRASVATATAAISKAKADVMAADAGITTAESDVIRAGASVAAAQATIERIQSDINDCTLKAPRAGRIQYRIAQPGEVVGPGGKVLNMVDLADVYMTFFLPTAAAGRVKMGGDTRLILDAAPELVIPARVTFVDAVAQFTPKTVETAEERQKLTFRVKAHIDPELLRQYVGMVKTGLPGVAYVQLEPPTPWPARFQVSLPKLSQEPSK